MLRSEWRERQADLRVDLNLVDAVELIFDRVFGRDDLAVGFVLDFDQRAVERGRFAGAGRAGDEHDAVRQVESARGTFRTVSGSMPSWRRSNFIAALVQNTHDDAFAVQHRDDGDADVDLAAGNVSLMRPSCGSRFSAMFSRAMIFRRLMIAAWKRLISGGMGCGLQHAVDAIADLDAARFAIRCGRRSLGLDRFDQDFVDEANDRGFLGLFGKLGRRSRYRRAARCLVVLGGGQQAVDRFAADAEVRFDLLGDFGPGGEHRLDRTGRSWRSTSSSG